ncbi:hypothetical protein ES319_D01G140300v1 [Gossypium barbadense]|uniref:Uncharacterized protein n=2 Tax=Gossypium TaxID=3633 RepID=A0A5J5SS59_GOSBA|nr:hypothetical protein ES319_D01G140300v1 [Gossypium barbadense]TYG83228.1 hypothetical protein ES288_D01G152600v1 [Gossypium darwinii]
MRREEVAFGSVADLTFRFWHNKASTVFSHLGAQRAIGNDSTMVVPLTEVKQLTVVYLSFYLLGEGLAEVSLSFQKRWVGVGQANKVIIIPDIQSAGDRSGGSHKVKNFHPFAFSFNIAYSGLESNRKGSTLRD